MTDKTEAMDRLIAQDADLLFDAQPTQTDALKIAREALHYAEQGFICYVENIDVATATGPEKGYALSFMILAKQCGNALAALEQSK